VADIFVLANRFFSLTDDAGRYRIQGLPEGEYVLRVWHIFGGADQKNIRVSSQPWAFDFTLRSVQGLQDIIEHPNKTGQSYSISAGESY
jgi:hypothetical protein